MNNVARGILTVILSLALAGFGLCGAVGTFSGLAGMSSPGPENFSSVALVFGLIGLAIAGVCLLLLVKLLRKRPPGTR
ncbi:hypothetical protein IA69_16605 [Massilia sp. JS1662]|nr:hypothetical protein [Massilia sp. JS1662]KGF80656.1 hypothetical protein IA69_16605 [Massilia sp. JS1662]